MKKKISAGFLLSCTLFMNSSILGLTTIETEADGAIVKEYKDQHNDTEKENTTELIITKIIKQEKDTALTRLGNLKASINVPRSRESTAKKRPEYFTYLNTTETKINTHIKSIKSKLNNEYFYDVSATIGKTAIAASAATLALIYLSQNEWVTSANPTTGYYSLLTLAKGPCLYSAKKSWQALQFGITTLAKIK